MEIETGIYGAKQQSYHSRSPRAVLLRALEDFPDKSDAELFEEVLRQLTGDDDLISAVAKYWFANELNNIRRKPVAAQVATERMAKAVVVAQQISAKIDERVRIILSEMVMPSGVRLRDSDKTECARAGGWFTKIAEQLREGQRVGDVLSEDQLQKLYLGQ